MSKSRQRATVGALALLTTAAAWGCGSSEAPAVPAAKTAESARAPAPTAPPANRPPELRSVSIEPREPAAGDLITALVDAHDPDGDAVRLTHRWVIDGRTHERGEQDTLVLPESSKGALVELEVVPNDGRLNGAPGHARVRVGNRPPFLVDLVVEPEGEATVEDELAASARVNDPDRDPVEIRYRWVVNGRAIDAKGSTLDSRHFRRGDRIQVEAVASDGDDDSEPLRSTEVLVVNSPPRIVSTPDQIGKDGTFRYTVAVEDLDDRRLRYRLLEGPKGMKLDWLSGRLAWTPSKDQEGTHPVEIEVDDLAGGKATQAFELKVGFEQPEQPEKAAEPGETPAAPQP